MSLPPLFDKGFPKYTKETFNTVDVFWYEADFTQSKYPPGQEISEACTLICLLVAQRISNQNIDIVDIDNNLAFNVAMAEAIIEGNSIHSHIVKNKIITHPYLNAEEALEFGGGKLSILKEWKFKVFKENLDRSLYKNMKSFLCDWYKKPKSQNLFMLLITCGRTVLFVFQEKTEMVTLFDSHGHNNARFPNRGLVVAQTSIENVGELCNWYTSDVMHNCYNLEADQYELTLLFRQKPLKTSACPQCSCSRSYRSSGF